MLKKYHVINKSLVSVDNGSSYKRIQPNIFETVKAECIAHAKGNLDKFLPYFCLDRDADNLPDLELWRNAFSSDNPPEKIKFDSRLEDLIRDIDFSKPFNSELAESIRSRFIVKEKKQPNVDADLIIQGELGELDKDD